MLDIVDLTFRYKRVTELFSGLNLHLQSGRIYGLLGKNGVGKTTLLRLIAGLLFPLGGSCYVMGFVPQKRDPEFLSELYFIPEEFYVPPVTIERYLQLFAPFYSNFNKDFLLKALKEFDLSPKEKLTALSYGQKKKFLVAFGLATNCKLLLLDEPTNGLDIPSKGQFRRLVAEALTDDKTIVVSTHQVRDVENLIDTVMVLQQGEVIFNQSIYDVSRKLVFQREQDVYDKSAIIYSEKNLSGGVVITENKGDYDSNIDLELLFNSIISNKEKINSVFATGEKHD